MDDPAAPGVPESSTAPAADTDARVEWAPPTPISNNSISPSLSAQPTPLEPEEPSDSEDDDYEPSDPAVYAHTGYVGPRRKRTRPFKPSYYYPTEGSLAKGVPVFEPTMDEFRDFYSYIQKIDKYGMRSGIVKVVPPKEWTDALPSVDDNLKEARIKDPITQHFMGSQGLFRVTNVAKNKLHNAKQWHDFCNSEKYETPNFFNNQDIQPKARSRKRKNSTVTPRRAKRARSDSHDNTSMMPPTPNSADFQHDDDDDYNPRAASPTFADRSHNRSNMIIRDANGKRLTTQAKNALPDDAEWEGFDYQALPNGAKTDDYTVDACKEIERRYWRTLTFGEPPMYGADTLGSLFDDRTTSWNVANLEDLLMKVNPHNKIPGVNTPYLYFGMWKASFSWHVEDADLYSINYIHFGAPKFWYSVPQAQSEKFNRTMAGFFPNDRAKCPEFLRHKSFLASPKVLANNGIHLNRCVQLPGEFMITYPYGYHSGFNLGFNCAESINFATENWLDIGRKAKACTCVEDSVTINVDAWLAEARLAAELARDGNLSNIPVPKPQPQRQPKKRMMYYVEQLPPQRQPPPPPKPKKATTSKQRTPTYPCAMCPSMETSGLVPVESYLQGLSAHKICALLTPSTWVFTTETGEELIRGFDAIEKERWTLKCGLCTVNHGTKIQCTKSQKCVRAFHPSCAIKSDTGVHVDAVTGCGSDLYSLIQPVLTNSEPAMIEPPLKAFVASATDGKMALPITNKPSVLATPLEMAQLDAEQAGTINIVALCKQHNPDFVKQQAERKKQELHVRVSNIPVNSIIQVRTSGGIYDVSLLSVNEPVVEVRFADGKITTFKYSAIVWPETLARLKPPPIKGKIEDNFVYEGKVMYNGTRTRPADMTRTNSGGYGQPWGYQQSNIVSYPGPPALAYSNHALPSPSHQPSPVHSQHPSPVQQHRPSPVQQHLPSPAAGYLPPSAFPATQALNYHQPYDPYNFYPQPATSLYNHQHSSPVIPPS